MQRIEVVTDDETDFSAVMVTIKDDATGKEDTYSAKELAGMDITEIRSEVQTKFDAIYKHFIAFKINFQQMNLRIII